MLFPTPKILCHRMAWLPPHIILFPNSSPSSAKPPSQIWNSPSLVFALLYFSSYSHFFLNNISIDLLVVCSPYWWIPWDQGLFPLRRLHCCHQNLKENPTYTRGFITIWGKQMNYDMQEGKWFVWFSLYVAPVFPFPSVPHLQFLGALRKPHTSRVSCMSDH